MIQKLLGSIKGSTMAILAIGTFLYALITEIGRWTESKILGALSALVSVGSGLYIYTFYEPMYFYIYVLAILTLGLVLRGINSARMQEEGEKQDASST